MKLPTLKRDTATEIRKATEQSAQASAKLVSLREERSRLLVEADIEAIAPIDAQIAAQERLIATLQERLRALDEKHKKERHANRLSEKEKAVAAFAKEFRAKRVDPAVQIIELLGQLGDAYKQYRETRDTPFRTKWRTDLFPNYVGDRYSPFTPRQSPPSDCRSDGTRPGVCRYPACRGSHSNSAHCRQPESTGRRLSGQPAGSVPTAGH